MSEIPDEVKFLFARVRRGEMKPIDFCLALDRHGLTHVEKMLYIKDAFGLPLEQAKKVLIEAEYGSAENWSLEMANVIAELESQLDNVKATVNHSQNEKSEDEALT